MKLAKILFLLTFLILVACDPKSDRDESSGPNKIIFVKGDPRALVAGSTMNSKSPITDENIQQWNSMSLLSLNQFVEKEEVALTKDSDIQKGNETTDHTKTNESTIMQISVKRSDTGHWQLVLLNGGLVFDLEPAADGRLQIVRAFSANKTMPLKVIHWSETPDGNYKSVLMEYLDDKDGRGLAAFYFEKSAPAGIVPTTDPKHVFSAGPGKKIGWATTKNLKIQTCGGDSESQTLSKNSADMWNAALNNRLKIDYSHAAVWAPFSDLNQHCIYVVDAYLEEHRPNISNYGTTVPVRSLTRVEYVDADIFIYTAEIRKLYQNAANAGYTAKVADYVRQRDIPIIYTHEMGHMLGLGHKFDGTLSIMSYEYKTTTPSAYDIAALAELYPLRRGSN